MALVSHINHHSQVVQSSETEAQCRHVLLPRFFLNTFFHLLACRSFLFLHMHMLRRLPPRSIFPPGGEMSVILRRRGPKTEPVAGASIVDAVIYLDWTCMTLTPL